MFFLFFSSNLQALTIYPEDQKEHYIYKKDHHNRDRYDKDRYDRDRYDRDRYDDYYRKKNCENKAERSCCYYKNQYREYIDLSEYYRRIRYYHRADEYRRLADKAMRNYRNCLSRELNSCRYGHHW